MRIAVFGSVGAYYGARLAAEGAEVGFFAVRPSPTLSLRSPRGNLDLRLPERADPTRFGTADFVFFGVPAAETVKTAVLLQPLIGPSTAVVSLQEGLGGSVALAGIVGRDRILAGLADVELDDSEPGVLVHRSGSGRLIFGEPDGRPSERTTRLQVWMLTANVAAELVEDVAARRWERFASVATPSIVTAAADLPIGTVRSVHDSWELFRGLLAEIARVAAADGSPLTPAALERCLDHAHELDPEWRSPLRQELERGNGSLFDSLIGGLVELADEHDLDAPIARTLHALLRPHLTLVFSSPGGGGVAPATEGATAHAKKTANP